MPTQRQHRRSRPRPTTDGLKVAQVRSEERCLVVGTTGTGIRVFQGTPFIDGQPASHTVVLVGGPSQAGVSDLSVAADDFCFADLVKRGIGISSWEEQLSDLVQAGSTAGPRQSG